MAKKMENKPNITDFSHELLCEILKYLPLKEILSVAMLCKKMLVAVDMHLRLCKSIDFCQDTICGYMPSLITDDHLLTLLKKCPHLEIVYGLHPIKIERRRLRKRSALTIPGIIEALSLCTHLKAIEISDLRLFEAIMQHLPQLEIIGHFQNRDGLFPPQASQRLKLQPYPRISSLHLTGVEIPELTAMPHLQHLHLQCVRFTKLQPFRAFLAQNLKSFVMKHCIGPSVPQRYLSLIIALSSSPNLSHLELVRVPLLNGLFQRAVEDSYRHNGFVNLKTLIIAGCKGILEADLGHLMIVASKNLETLYIQPSLTKDSFFVSLSYSQCSFPNLQNLHLGYVDNLNSSGEWSNDALLSFGLAEIPDTPSSITDSGMKVVSQLFPHIKSLSASNCPHLMIMFQWMDAQDMDAWSKLTDLTLQKCHCLQLSSFTLFVAFLRNVHVVILNDMFREPPKGCSHVGLSAGTGLGMSSAVVSNQDEHIDVQGHQQDFDHPGDEENEENEREFIDVESDDDHEPQFMVLQRDFFDADDDDDDVPMVEDQVLEHEHSEESDSDENYSRTYSTKNNAVEKKVDTVKIESVEKLKNDHCYCASPNEERYHLRSKKYPQSFHADKKFNRKKKTNVSNREDIKKDDKNTVVSTKIVSTRIQEYDPHKPSTSKAGSHLDYPSIRDTNQCSTSDSESDVNYKYGSNFNQFKKSSNKKTASKDVKKTKLTRSSNKDVSKISCSIKKENVDSELENNSSTKNCENFQADSLNNPPRNKSFSSKCYESIKMCKVLVTKCDDRLFSEASNSCANISNINSESEMRSSSQNSKSISIGSNHSNFELENKENVPGDSHSSEKVPLNFIKSDTLNDKEQFHKPFLPNSESDICIQSVKNTREEVNFSVSNVDLLKCKSCYIYIEKLKEQPTSIDNSSQSENTKKGNSLKDNNSLEVMSYNDCSHDIKSKDENSKLRNDKDSKIGQKTGNQNVFPCNSFDKNIKPKNLSCFEETNNASINQSSTYTASSEKKMEICLNCSEISCCCSKKMSSKCTSSNKIVLKDFSYPFDESESMINNKKIKEDLKTESFAAPNAIHNNVHKLVAKGLPKDEAENINIPHVSTATDSENKINDISNLSNNDANVLPKLKPCISIEKTDENPSCTTAECTEICTCGRDEKNVVNNVTKSQNLQNVESDYFHSSISKNSDVNKSELQNVKDASKNRNEVAVNTVEPNYYVIVPSDPCRSIDIINSVTGQSYRVPFCRVSISPNMENHDNLGLESVIQHNNNDSEKLNIEKSDLNSFDGNLHLPSASSSVINYTSGKYDLHTATDTVNAVSQEYFEKTKTESNTSCSETETDIRNSKGEDSKNGKGDNSQIDKSFNDFTDFSEMSELEMLKITNSDAVWMLLTKCSDSEENKRLNLHNKKNKRLNLHNEENKRLILRYEEHKKQILQFEENKKLNLHNEENEKLNLHSEAQDVSSIRRKRDNISLDLNENVKNNSFESTSERHSSLNESNDISENSGYSPSSESSSKCVSHERIKKKCTSKLSKRKRRSSCFSGEHSDSYRHSRFSRRIQSRSIFLVSQGTQVTASDIRRSARHMRRAQKRKNASSIHASRCSSYSSKTSAKVRHKIPVNTNPEADVRNKATCTSDPLLEDDAVQMLQITSNTLLSFTVISCGLSDLIMESCPKLFHMEVQACRILKNIELNSCPAMKKLNVSQCPKMNIRALVKPVLSLTTDSYFLVSYEPCMQSYHPGEGEKAILSKALSNQSVLVCHDFCDVSHEGIQGGFREKLIIWLRYLSTLYSSLNYTLEESKQLVKRAEKPESSEFPWSHDIQKINGQYTCSPSIDFCMTEGRYQLVSNSPIFCNIFETRQLDTGFPSVRDCEACRDYTLLFYEAVEKYMQMKKKMVAFYIPITESNQINSYK